MCTRLTNEYGNSLTPDELRNRINNMTTKYRQERKIIGPSGGVPSNWQYYKDIHKMIGGYKSNFTQGAFENGSDTLVASADMLPNEDEIDEIPSTSSCANKSKINNNEDFLEMARKEQKLMEHYLNKSIENEEKALV